MDDTRDLIRIGEAARILNRHPKTVRAWAKKGHLRCVMSPGKQRLFRRSDVEALLSIPDEVVA